MRRLNYKLPAPRKRLGNFFPRFLLLLILIVSAWLWWHFANALRPKSTLPAPAPAAPAAPVVSRSAPAQVSAEPKPAFPPPSAPTATTNSAFPRPVQNVFEAQLALLQYGISSGSIDGAIGSQTRAALASFQLQQNLPATGELDTNTRSRLVLTNSPYTTYTVTSNDLARLQPLATTWLGKSQQSALDYETILELVAEKFFANPNFIRRVNPSLDWSNIAAGAIIQVPNAAYPEPRARAAFVKIHLSGKTLEAFDDSTNLLAHFPCSIARRVEKRPVGELHVAVVAPNPNYTFDPAIFPESPEAQQLDHKLILPPGPNNPVGVVWIGLDLPGYGIHGTPSPEQVGRTESHGCFRLANWNATLLLRLITIGTPVYVEE